jgi:hypothetical protein
LPENKVSVSGNWKVHGSTKPKLLIAGHSHTYAMFCAMLNREKFHQNIAVATQTDFSTVIPLDNEYWDFVAKESKNQTTAISWNGNQHNVHFLIEQPETFKIFGLESSYESESASISISRVNALFEPTFTELRKVLSKFPDTKNLILLGTPAPKPKSAIESRLVKETYYIDIAKTIGVKPSEIKVSSDALRVFMWKITQTLTEQAAKEFGCKFLGIPSRSLDQYQTLKEIYWANDVTHASEEFASIFMDEILERIE